MTSQESSSNSQGQQYMSKKVIINGQFVTLYSLNGLTWLSSPEDLQDTMARLDNTRVTLAEEKGEKDEKGEKGDKGDKDAKTEKAPAILPKLASSQYRMKGPKPRPILRQGGKAIEGSPIEVPSAAAVNVKAGLDPLVPQVKLTPAEKTPRRAKLVAPIAQKRPGQVKQPKSPPPAKVAAPAKGLKGKVATPVAAPVKAKSAKKGDPVPTVKGKKAAPAPAPKTTKTAAAPKKSAKPVKVVKQAKKTAAKPAKVKKPASKSSGKKSSKR